MQFNIPVEIQSSEVTVKKGISKAGKQYEIREQSGYIALGKPYPVEFRFSLEFGSDPYPPGRYAIDSGCLYVNRFGQLALGRIRLLREQGGK